MISNNSHLLNNLGEYTHKLWGERAQKTAKASGKKVIDLGKGTPDIRPSELYMEKLREHLSDKKAHFYPGYTPSPAFTHAMSHWYKKQGRGSIKQSEIAVVSGAKDAIMHLPFTFLNSGDRCLVPDPGYPPFSQSITIVGATPVPYSSFENLLSLLATKPKAVWINSPCNPTGAMYTREELTAIVDMAQKYNILVWYDAAYIDITYDGTKGISIFEIPGAKEVALEIGSFSKSHSFAGLRIGWVAGDEKFIQPFLRMKSFFDSGVSLPIQYMTADSLSAPDTLWHQNTLDTYTQRRDDVITLLQPYFPETIQKPSAGLYLWIPIPEGHTSESFALMMLEKNHILITPGTAFGRNGEGFVRASFSADIYSSN